jgi:hypothetical protein
MTLPTDIPPSQGTSQDSGRSPKLTINNIPDELLVEIIDFYRQGNADRYQWWSKWFKLIHVCKRWRTVMFASSSRLDLCFVLKPRTRKGGNIKTILSRHFPPLPIDINYDYQISKAMSRILAALKHPGRIRGINLIGTGADLQKVFRATRCPFPALESLTLCATDNKQLEIPVTFLKGSDLHLRSLRLHGVYLPSISRFLLAAPALTDLSLRFDTVGPPSAMSFLLTHFQGMPCLRHLNLKIRLHNNDLAQPTEPKEKFLLSKLTSFHYHGHSAYLNTLVTGFKAPSLREVNVQLSDSTMHPILHISRLIEDTGEHHHAVQVVLERYYFRLLLLPLSEKVGDHRSPRFTLCTHRFPESIMQTSSAFSAKLATTEKLFVSHSDINGMSEEDIPWRRFLLQFPSVKTLRLEMKDFRNLRIPRFASVLHEDHEEPNHALLPALEEIELCLDSYWSSEPAPELEAFQPFVSARQQAGIPVRVFCGRPSRLS